MIEDNDHEERLKHEVLDALRWATRALETGVGVEDTMQGFINRLQDGDEWFREPALEEEPSLEHCSVCGKKFGKPLSAEEIMRAEKIRNQNKAVYPSRVCTDCYNDLDIRSPYKASMN